ncbi:pirin [Komagataeibacter melaceti]|uniref:Pirin n=1 Tax=Komagataeibacter melaceti TaxID=2766577 RepID=A0A371Z0W3_9PROT|nr:MULTISPECIES: replication protein RepA [Komagataeibacter]RFD20136.1 pirin [Komagataeibacter melaceti]
MGEIHSLLEKFGISEMRRIAALEGKTQRMCVDAAHEVMSDEDQAIGIAHAGFAMAALPHKKIMEPIWRREGGSIRLLVESGIDQNDRAVGIPFGAMARLILLYLQTQAVRTRSREVELGASMNAWLKAMGVSVGGKTYTSVRDQANRISRCRLTFTRTSAGAEIITNGAFVRDAIMPIEQEDGSQLTFWREAVRLDEGFYESLIEHPLPLREIAIRQISNKSKAIDIYIWLAYRLHVLNDPLTLTWSVLKNQFGPEYKELRYFKKDIITPFKIALSVYPEARVHIDEKKGMILYPSPPPIPERKIGR